MVEEEVVRVDESITVLSPPREDKAYWVIKRCLDILISSAAIVLLFPLWFGIGLMIKLTSHGPIFYVERREIGKNGRPFALYKFRTMYAGSDNSIHRQYYERFVEGQPAYVDQGGDKRIFKIPNDPRVTPIGRILRQTGLDEAPQFINVLKGDMSLVGPRPAILYEYELYEDWHRQRLSVPPGITGLYQVTARSQVSFDEMVRIDLEYIRRRSLWLDLKIMLLTPINVIILGKGGY